MLTEGFPHRTFNPPPGHCEPVLTLACPKEIPLGYGNPFPCCESFKFQLNQRSSAAPKPPLCKGRWCPQGHRRDCSGHSFHMQPR